MRRDQKLWRLRVGIEDRPGALATLATTLGVHDVDVLRIDVVSREEVAVDDIWIELPPGGSIESLDLVLRRLPGVVIRGLFPVAEVDDPVSVMAAACARVGGAAGADKLRAAVEGACHVGGAEHAVLVSPSGDGSMDVVASTLAFTGPISGQEGCLARDAGFGGRPLAVPGSYPWGPESWRATVNAAWVAAVPLMTAGAMICGLIIVRERKFSFESGELSRLSDYGRVLVATMRDSMQPTESALSASEVLVAAQ